MRLDKLLSQYLEISRREVERELKQGKIQINDTVIKIGRYRVEPTDRVTYDNTPIEFSRAHRYFMLNKPKGYVCANQDPTHPPINYLLDEWASEKLFSVGRLDVDTTGLVLLTDDGKWSHRITSPKNHCTKCYKVTLYEAIKPTVVEQFANGILLKGEKRPTLPVHLEIITATEVRVTLSEGRYHQVKRMFAAVGNHVVALHRESIGQIVLDVGLEEGQYRALTEFEQQQLGQKTVVSS